MFNTRGAITPDLRIAPSLSLCELLPESFHSREDAQRGYAELRRAGYSPDDINLLAPGASEEQVHSVPVSATEQPGVGKAIGGVVGAALGMAGGFELGVGMTALVPGVGPVLAAGLAGMALLGAGGAFTGAALGSKADQDSTEGLPADEIFFYEDALRQGRTVIIVMANGATEAAARPGNSRRERRGEPRRRPRGDWWIGLRNAESEHYRALGHNFENDHEVYRARLRGRPPAVRSRESRTTPRQSPQARISGRGRATRSAPASREDGSIGKQRVDRVQQ